MIKLIFQSIEVGHPIHLYRAKTQENAFLEQFGLKLEDMEPLGPKGLSTRVITLSPLNLYPSADYI